MRFLAEAFENTQVALKSHVNTQLVIEELLLKTWPLASKASL